MAPVLNLPPPRQPAIERFAAPIAALRGEISVDGAEVTFGDLFELGRLPPEVRAAAAEISIARFRPGQSTMVLSSQRIVERARGLVPALGAYLPDGAPTPVVVRSQHAMIDAGTAKTGSNLTPCVRAKQTLEPQTVLLASDFAAEAPCGAAAAPFHYDASRKALVAVRSIPEGEIIAAPPAFSLAGVRPGQTILLRTQVGPVMIERAVRAVQAARPQQSVFVVGSDNTVFPVSAAEIRP